MHVYKFRLTIEESDEFVREYEILSNQTFEDFHTCILQSVGFDGSELASFFICNDKWYKKSEITLLDMSDATADVADMDDDIRVKKSDRMKRYIMADSSLHNFIEDPHQHILYEYDFLNVKTFYIELLKIQAAQPHTNYPVCTVSKADYPKSGSIAFSPLPEEFEDVYQEEYDDKEDSESDYGMEDMDDLGLDTDDFGSGSMKNHLE